jgi:hypothetical protein
MPARFVVGARWERQEPRGRNVTPNGRVWTAEVDDPSLDSLVSGAAGGKLRLELTRSLDELVEESEAFGQLLARGDE